MGGSHGKLRAWTVQVRPPSRERSTSRGPEPAHIPGWRPGDRDPPPRVAAVGGTPQPGRPVVKTDGSREKQQPRRRLLRNAAQVMPALAAVVTASQVFGCARRSGENEAMVGI